MAISMGVVFTAAGYVFFHKKINKIIRSVAAGISEGVKIATRGYRDKKRIKKKNQKNKKECWQSQHSFLLETMFSLMPYYLAARDNTV